MGHRLPSYRADIDHCQYSSKAKPCWGKVEITDELYLPDYSDSYVIRQCEGHAMCHDPYNPSTYLASNYDEDEDATVIEDDQ